MGGLVHLVVSLSLRNVVVVLPPELWNAIRPPCPLRNLYAIGHVVVKRIVGGIAAVNAAAPFLVPVRLFLVIGTHISALWFVERSWDVSNIHVNLSVTVATALHAWKLSLQT